MLILLLACAPMPTAEAAPQTSNETRDMVRLHMSEHLARALSASDAVVRGDLARARSDLGWMADHVEPEPVVEASAAGVAALHTAARDGIKGSTANDYGVAVGKMGAACGSCHTTAAAGLSPMVASKPTGADHKALDSWIVSSMWTGLVANNTETWTSAANALGAAPTTAAGYGVSPSSPGIDAAVATLSAAAKTAPMAQDRNARAEAYGKVIGACGTCHIEARQGR